MRDRAWTWGLAVLLAWACNREGSVPPEAPAAPAAEAEAEPRDEGDPRCGEGDRGEPSPDDEYLGETLLTIERNYGDEVVCRGFRPGEGTVVEIIRGTLCGDISSFHEEVTVVMRGGVVRRAWVRERYNDRWCAEG